MRLYYHTALSLSSSLLRVVIGESPRPPSDFPKLVMGHGILKARIQIGKSFYPEGSSNQD